VALSHAVITVHARALDVTSATLSQPHPVRSALAIGVVSCEGSLMPVTTRQAPSRHTTQ
jgi:hypothetical protein